MDSKNKKAQGLEWSTIILAALGAILLVIVVALVLGRTQLFGATLSTCPGECMLVSDCKQIDGYDLGGNYKMSESQRIKTNSEEGSTCGKPEQLGSDEEQVMTCCSKKSK